MDLNAFHPTPSDFIRQKSDGMSHGMIFHRTCRIRHFSDRVSLALVFVVVTRFIVYWTTRWQNKRNHITVHTEAMVSEDGAFPACSNFVIINTHILMGL